MKRIIDILISIGVLFISLPLLLFISVLNIFFNKGKIFFLQDRTGHNGKVFQIIKFKTMNDIVDANGELLSDGERLTVFGRFLRLTSLDELPTLWNVLLGHMSLVGPRPLLVEYLNRYSKDQLRRLEVNPGITGWAQINGRNSISWEAKFQYDVWYVDNQSLKLDLIIIFKTIKQVIRGKGISHKNHPTMEEFRGTDK
jgi:lipopolysaccharide/colanic/teichoic acid biosynthesis glycosyltransferase